MKKLAAFLFAVLLLFTLAACGAATAEETQPTEVPADIEVAVSFVRNQTAKVVTRKLSDKELKSVDLCCVYFDERGKKVGQIETVQCDFSEETELAVWTFATEPLSAYMEVTISGVTYADDTKRTCIDTATWSETAIAEFTVEKHQKKLEQLAETEAAQAEICDAVELKIGRPAGGTLELGVKNNSDKALSEVVSYLLWFDAAGDPIDMSGVFVPNSEKLSAKALEVGEDAIYNATAPERAVYVKGIVHSVRFADGETWENDHIYEWALVQYAEAN